MMSSLDICRPAEVVGEVRRHYTLQTLIDEKGELIIIAGVEVGKSNAGLVRCPFPLIPLPFSSY